MILSKESFWKLNDAEIGPAAKAYYYFVIWATGQKAVYLTLILLRSSFLIDTLQLLTFMNEFLYTCVTW